MILTDEQKEIVVATENKIGVIGPPGTGKTRVLTERIRHLLSLGVNQKDIVAITFTNFAANEMRARLPECNGMFIGTMHSYAAAVLMKNGIPLNLSVEPTEQEFEQIIKTATKENIIKPNIEYLFVDEVQDLCLHEFEFVDSLKAKNLFLAGDPDQSIYQFKGAKPRLFINYCKAADTKLYTLTHNFRCGQNIISWAEYFVNQIKDRINITVVGNLIERGWVHRVVFEDALLELINSRKYGSWFILTRTNSELIAIERILSNYEVPYVTFKQSEISNEEANELMSKNVVKLLTIHSAKGLEADNVIVVGARNTSLEECCIEYVASTRARRDLYWCPQGLANTRYAARVAKTKNKRKAELNKVGIRWE